MPGSSSQVEAGECVGVARGSVQTPDTVGDHFSVLGGHYTHRMTTLASGRLRRVFLARTREAVLSLVCKRWGPTGLRSGHGHNPTYLLNVARSVDTPALCEDDCGPFRCNLRWKRLNLCLSAYRPACMSQGNTDAGTEMKCASFTPVLRARSLCLTQAGSSSCLTFHHSSRCRTKGEPDYGEEH